MEAPIRVTMPSSTACSSASCWAFEKRWISSMKSTVRRPVWPRRSRALSMTLRTSATPELTADNSSYTAPTASATSRATVVLPVPGGPKKIIERTVPVSMATRSGAPSPSRWRCPTTSSSLRGRMRAASGAFCERSAPRPELKRSCSMPGFYQRTRSVPEPGRTDGPGC